MELGIVLSFIGASIVLTLMPGPDNIFVLTESLTKGKRNGMLISVGLCLGVLVHTIAAATGLSIIIQRSAMAFSIVQYAGAVYLFYLAYQAMKEKKPVLNLDMSSSDENIPVSTLIRKGFLMNVLNPKVSLFFIAFLPQFTTAGGVNVTIQMIILGLLFMLQALLIFGLISILSSSLTEYVNSSKFWRTTKWGKVSVLAILGLTLILTKK